MLLAGVEVRIAGLAGCDERFDRGSCSACEAGQAIGDEAENHPGGRTRIADPCLYALLAAFRRLLMSGAVSPRRERRRQGEIASLLLAPGRSGEIL